MPDFAAIFVYLEEQPLLWLFVTLSAYLLAEQVHRYGRQFALLNPVLLSAAVIALVLGLSRTSYTTYFAGAQFIHVLLGPAIVGLAVPVVRHRAALWRAGGGFECGWPWPCLWPVRTAGRLSRPEKRDRPDCHGHC